MKISYFFLGSGLFLLLNASKERVDDLRAHLVTALSPFWQTVAFAAKEPSHRQEEVELCLLRAQVEELKERLASEPKGQPFATAAKVLFRDPSHWSSSIWIALGEEDNQGQMLIGKNSPVLLGGSLIGVVEYVGSTQSRVRLITDAGLTAAVRAVRGGTQDRELLSHLELLVEQVGARPDLFSSSEEQQLMISQLTSLQQRLVPGKEALLAKGELRGCSDPLWRSLSPTLKGTGFNYDVADAAGPARDLHAPSLLKTGDLLATSGLDGVFPAGIPVAIVTKIKKLKEGDFFYTLEAKPTAGSLQDLHTVFVLPPHG